MASVKQVCNNLTPAQNGVELQKLLGDVQADLAALRSAFVALTAKLDADATVTDTNYGSLTNPPAQRTTA